ncbi:MAG: hypothetical protein ACN4GR_17290 [Arenicellales bacterium]
MKQLMFDHQVSSAAVHVKECKDVPIHESLRRLELEQQLQKLALEKQIILIEDDDLSLAAFMTGFLVERIISQCYWRTGQLSVLQKKAVWFVMLAMSERISQTLDVSSAQVATYAAMWVFKHDQDYQFGAMVKEMQAEYLCSDISSRLRLMILKKRIDIWMHRSDFTDTGQIASVANMLAKPLSQ